MSAISTHVLDVAAGRPAAGLEVRLEHVAPAGAAELARATTDSGGRINTLGPELLERAQPAWVVAGDPVLADKAAHLVLRTPGRENLEAAGAALFEIRVGGQFVVVDSEALPAMLVNHRVPANVSRKCRDVATRAA